MPHRLVNRTVSCQREVNVSHLWCLYNIHTCMYLCVYILYVCMYVYTYVYTHICRPSCPPFIIFSLLSFFNARSTRKRRLRHANCSKSEPVVFFFLKPLLAPPPLFLIRARSTRVPWLRFTRSGRRFAPKTHTPRDTSRETLLRLCCTSSLRPHTYVHTHTYAENSHTTRYLAWDSAKALLRLC